MSDPSSKGAAPNNVWAILIGIDAYPGNITDLKGCIRDVENVERFLSDHFENHRLRVMKLTSAEPCDKRMPTFENIVETINHVRKEVKPKDFVYFHFSGHGGRQLRSKDTKPSEGPTVQQRPKASPNSYFECLILHGTRHMKDYELGGYFNDLAGTGATLFAVLDCCHSGGADRAGNQNVRQINHVLPPDVQSTGPEEDIAAVFETSHRAASVTPSYWTRAREYTLLAACHPHQFASECKDSMGNENGALTLTMLASIELLLQKAQPATYKSLFSDIRATIGLKSSRQDPKLFGEEGRVLFSLEDGLDSHCAMVVKTESEDNRKTRVFIDQGKIHGVHVNETRRIYRRGDSEQREAITTMMIDKVGAIQSSGLLPGDVSGVECGCSTSLKIPVYGEHLQVIVKDANLRKDLAERDKIGVVFQESGYDGADYEIGSYDENLHRILDASAAPIAEFQVHESENSAAEEIHEFLKTLAHYSRVLNLRTYTKDLLTEFEFSVEDDISRVCNGARITLKFKNLRSEWRGDPADQNRHNELRSLYFTVLNLRIDRKVILLIPDPEIEGISSISVAPGDTHTTEINMSILPTDGDVTEVTDIFKVIVTDRPASFQSLATENIMRAGTEATGDFDRQFNMILQGAGDYWSRAAGRTVDPKWQTDQVTVIVSREDSHSS